jgi:hypothetical protein
MPEQSDTLDAVGRDLDEARAGIDAARAVK